MTNRIIRFCYRKIIDASSQQAWDKMVFDSSYNEFLMQVQFYNQQKKYNSFGEIILQEPSAEKLHFLVSTSVTGYLQQLKGTIPGILNSLGRHFLQFKEYKFEIINSDIKQKQAHQIAINFFSEPMKWIDTVGDYLLVAEMPPQQTADGELTHLLQLKPFLSIYSVKEEI